MGLEGMFKSSKKPTGKPDQQAKSRSGGDPIGNSPLTAYEKGKREWFERMGSPIVERDRYFVLAALFGLAFVGVVGTLMNMMPLTRVEPFVVQVDKITGHAVATRAAAQAYKPGAAEKQYFIIKWVRGLLELDPNTTERALAEVYENSRGKAVEEFTDFVNKTKPIVRVRTETGLTRTVEIKSFSPLNDQSALVRLVTEERALNKGAVRRSYVITIHYAIDAPDTEAEIMKNPIGLFVTHFAINEDMS
jgi:type IV secretion system protein VirB5